jgi:hypothetical protein
VNNAVGRQCFSDFASNKRLQSSITTAHRTSTISTVTNALSPLQTAFGCKSIKDLEKVLSLSTSSDTFTEEKVFYNVIAIYKPYIANQVSIIIIICGFIQLQAKFLPF